MSKSAFGKYRKLIKDGKEYLNTRYDLLRLELLEKASSIVAVLILVMVALLLVGTVWIYISCILIVWMGNIFGSFIPAFLIMGGVNLLTLVLVFLLRNVIILNPLIRLFSKILFDNSGEKGEADEDEASLNESGKDKR